MAGYWCAWRSCCHPTTEEWLYCNGPGGVWKYCPVHRQKEFIVPGRTLSGTAPEDFNQYQDTTLWEDPELYCRILSRVFFDALDGYNQGADRVSDLSCAVRKLLKVK